MRGEDELCRNGNVTLTQVSVGRDRGRRWTGKRRGDYRMVSPWNSGCSGSSRRGVDRCPAIIQVALAITALVVRCDAPIRVAPMFFELSASVRRYFAQR